MSLWDLVRRKPAFKKLAEAVYSNKLARAAPVGAETMEVDKMRSGRSVPDVAASVTSKPRYVAAYRLSR